MNIPYVPYDAQLTFVAVAPAIVLMIYIYKKDRIEKEPTRLLLKLVLFGILSTIPAVILESIGTGVLTRVLGKAASTTLQYRFIMYFIVVGFSEEFCKYIMMKKATWKSPEFDCSFDAVVYAVFVALGFAVFENLGYSFMYGMNTALMRAVTSIPGHAAFDVFMGAYYGMAKQAQLCGKPGKSRYYRIMAVIVPLLLHGIYDFVASSRFPYVDAVFFGFVGIMFIDAFFKIRRLSQEDRYID